MTNTTATANLETMLANWLKNNPTGTIRKDVKIEKA